MNLSGGVVASFMKFYKIDYKDILIIQDDLDLTLGTVRLKAKSSAGGHNGIKDIIANIHTDEFARIKVGVSHDRSIDTKDYVLGKFGKSELELIESNYNKINNVIEHYNYDKLDVLMTDFNKRG
jgi:PTH1 family peptidyl-tRNA hydrolase